MSNFVWIRNILVNTDHIVKIRQAVGEPTTALVYFANKDYMTIDDVDYESFCERIKNQDEYR